MTTEALELFTYPHSPGHRGVDTSVKAAENIKGRAPRLRAACLIVLASGPKTADEVADALHESVLSIRPRMTELRAQGCIEPNGERRRNVSGQSARVMRLR